MIVLVLLACRTPLISFASEPPVNLTPEPALSFVDGPAIADSDALLAWLSANKGRTLQLPVVVAFDDEHRLAVKRASLGALQLRLDDTSMGVGILDRLRAACPPGPLECAVWLEGRWGPVMEIGGQPALSIPGFDSGPRRHDFAVRRLVGLADATATRARVAK